MSTSSEKASRPKGRRMGINKYLGCMGKHKCVRASFCNIFLMLLIAAATLAPMNEVFAQPQTFAAVRFWNVRNWYPNEGDEWQRHRYTTAQSAYSVEWAAENPGIPCGNGLFQWNYFHDVQASAYPDNFMNGRHMMKNCIGQVSGPYTYGSSVIHFKGCSNTGPWYEWGEPACQLQEDQADREANLGAPPCPDQCFGDPVNAGTGNKFEVHAEYRGEGSFPLEMVWTYNSLGTSIVATPTDLIFGRNRSHTYSRRVSLSSTAAVVTAYVSRPDGKTFRFNQVGSDWVGVGNIPAKLHSTTVSGGMVIPPQIS